MRPLQFAANCKLTEITMPLNWFNAKDAHQFGGDLAQFFLTQMPLDRQIKDKKFANKTQNLLIQMDRRVQQFKTSHKLNIYTRARLGNQFKWTLKDAGCEEAYLEELTEWLLQRL